MLDTKLLINLIRANFPIRCIQIILQHVQGHKVHNKQKLLVY